MRLGINRGAAGLNAVDIAYRFKRIQVENSQMPFRPTARSVQASSFDVREDVVKSAFAAHLDGLDDLIRTCGGRLLGQPHRR